MKRPAVFTGDYWRAELAGVRASVWRLIAFAICARLMQEAVVNNGYFAIHYGPGLDSIYYFGFDPAIWGFLAGVFFMLALNKARNRAIQRKQQLLVLRQEQKYRTIEYGTGSTPPSDAPIDTTG